MKNLNKNRVFRFNRRIRGLTDYKLRLNLLKSNLPRIVVRKSNKNMLVQIVLFENNSDKIVTSAKSYELIKLGYTLNTGNLVSAYLTGFLAGKRALKSKIKSEVIVDLGLQKSLFGNRIYATIKGILDAGIKVKVSDVVFPSQERLNGEHLKSKDVKKIIDKVKKSIEGMK